VCIGEGAYSDLAFALLEKRLVTVRHCCIRLGYLGHMGPSGRLGHRYSLARWLVDNFLDSSANKNGSRRLKICIWTENAAEATNF
jgi:hypothetical protein